MLEMSNVSVWYGQTQVLWDVSLTINTGEIVAVMGPNGSGKSTVFKAITGLVPVGAGTITWEGEPLTGCPPHSMASRGISLVLERRRLFPRMTVRENVLLGAFTEKSKSVIADTLERVEQLFPLVAERADSLANSLSGGQQQMVAIARGLMSRPRLVKQIVKILRTINEQGVTVLFNEQNARVSFGNSNRGYLLQSGRVVLSGSGMEMLEHPDVKSVYLGH
jgi:branched-chain amino acid transport system ATP-binding protein